MNMDEDSDEEFLEDSRNQGSKRILSTEDPDYTRPPDPKRMKEMEERAQDELRERVIKVVDGVLSNAANEKQAEIDEVDARILRIQQCLHTLRYCVSLNYHAASKCGSTLGTNKQSYEAHPNLRKHMGKAPVSSNLLTCQTKVNGDMKANIIAGPSSSSTESRKDDQPYSQKLHEKAKSIGKQSAENLEKTLILNASGCESSNTLLCPDGNDQTSQGTSEDGNSNSAKNLESSRPPSPKYLPPKPPDSETIAQGRHQRFQMKRRIVVGNTYQYLTPQAGRDVDDAMRYKWQIYVRVPTQENDIASFVSSVTFILDRSYAPHHIITLKHPPFVLSRRGWGEFKVQIVLKFSDNRNKQVQLLHPLVLSRPDDPLSLTGLWRLGQENWYDVWVYEGCSGETSAVSRSTSDIGDEELPATLEKELDGAVVSSQVEQHVTVFHGQEIPENKLGSGTQILDKGGGEECKSKVSEKVCDVDQSVSNIKVTVTEKLSLCKKSTAAKICNSSGMAVLNSVPQILTVTDSTSKSKSDEIVVSDKPVKEEVPSSSKTVASNGAQNKMCKIHVRQPDGRLVPYFIPAHMYSLALKIAQMRSSANGKSKSDAEKVSVSPSGSENTKITVKQLVEDSSSTSAKSVNLISGTNKIVTKLAGNPVSGNIKVETLDKSALSGKKCTLVGSEVKSSPSGTVTEIKIPIKPKDGNPGKNHGIPVKILNVSPSKKPMKVSSLLSGSASTSGSQQQSLLVQGKQAVVKSTALSQNALLQLLSKVGVKDRNTVVQQLLSKTGVKDGVVDVASLQKVQGQLISAQASQGTKCNVHLMPVKIVQDKQKTQANDQKVLNPSSGRILQQSVQPKNVKFVTNNGQLISTANLTKGMMINTSVRPNTVIKPITVNNSILTVASSSGKGTNSVKEKSNVFMMSDGRIITGSSVGLQTTSSQGKSGASQVNPIVINNALEKGKVVQMPQLIVGTMNNNSIGILQSVPSSSTSTTVTTTASKNITLTGVKVLGGSSLVSSVGPTPIRPLLKPRTATTTTAGLTTAPLVTNVSGKVNILPLKKGVIINATNSEKLQLTSKVADDVSKEHELTAQQIWEEQSKELVGLCKTLNSAEACVSQWVHALPLVSRSSQDPTRLLFPYRAMSSEQFLKWPLGKQRAAEFQRSRDVKRWLDRCKVDGREYWTVKRIVGWARRHAYTPVNSRQILSSDVSAVTEEDNRCDVTMTCLDTLGKLAEENNRQLLRSQEAGPQDVDVITIDDHEISKNKKLKLPASPMKYTNEVVPWSDLSVVNGCDWIGRKASELRINIPMEEVLPGFVADAGRAIAWKAVLTFMENLLRSSYSQAWEEKSSGPILVPPKVISFDNVKDALVKARPEYDLFTNEGLGTLVKDMEGT